MSDDASLRVTDAIRVELPDGFRPDAITIAHGVDGELRASLRGTGPDAAENFFDAPLGVRAARAETEGEDAAVSVSGRVVELIDRSGSHRFEPLSSRARAHAPAVARVNGRWAAAWVSEDTGKLVMARALDGEPSARVAEVWCALERPWASAPALVGDASGAWIAWREERGPRAGVYLRRLDETLRQVAREVRISDRVAVAAPGRVAMVSIGDRVVAVGWIELRDGVASAWVRTVAT